MKLGLLKDLFLSYKVPFPHEYDLEVGQSRVVLRSPADILSFGLSNWFPGNLGSGIWKSSIGDRGSGKPESSIK